MQIVFLGREGLSFAALRRMPPAVEALEEEDEGEEAVETEVERERAGVTT
jgi:hypothetical protein